jgi:hypothetical protein
MLSTEILRWRGALKKLLFNTVSLHSVHHKLDMDLNRGRYIVA